jgi:hypothetical protein
MPWLLETIRATVFAPDIKALGLSDWHNLTDTRPNQTQNLPETDGTVEAGPFMSHWLTMGIARRPGRGPGRADLVFSPTHPTVTVPLADPLQQRIEPAAIGPFNTNFQDFVKLARKWLSTDTNVRRLALSCTLWERTTTLDEALDIILHNVPSFKRAGDHRIVDFLIQINRPRDSRINPSISINRFVRWSARMVEIVVSPHMFRPPRSLSPRAQADLDISTAGGADIAGRQIPVHLTELADLVVEIAEKGDTP